LHLLLSITLQNQALLLSLGSDIHLLTSDKMPCGCIVGTMLIHHTSFASLSKFLCHPTGLCEHQQSYHRSCIRRSDDRSQRNGLWEYVMILTGSKPPLSVSVSVSFLHFLHVSFSTVPKSPCGITEGFQPPMNPKPNNDTTKEAEKHAGNGRRKTSYIYIYIYI
jgi:hypothetical protein